MSGLVCGFACCLLCLFRLVGFWFGCMVWLWCWVVVCLGLWVCCLFWCLVVVVNSVGIIVLCILPALNAMFCVV